MLLHVKNDWLLTDDHLCNILIESGEEQFLFVFPHPSTWDAFASNLYERNVCEKLSDLLHKAEASVHFVDETKNH